MNEIIWHYQSGGRAKSHFSRKHDNILFYRKSAAVHFDIDAVGTPRGAERRNHMKKTVGEDGRVSYSIRSGGKVYTYNEDALSYPSDVWSDISHLQQRDPERSGYATQKPLALLERIIRASSMPGDRVLDPFCGSGSTGVAALRNGRTFWGIDASEQAMRVVRRRLLLETEAGFAMHAPAQLAARAPNIVHDGAFWRISPETGWDCVASGHVADGAFLMRQCVFAPFEAEIDLEAADALLIVGQDGGRIFAGMPSEWP